ncbi:MAG: fibronectin type III domain-containing protein, partial [Betaproteobacteria bacterium]|nr:fibronectin type III domain-containing protein [Betaproteobacteria bacterium]
VPGPPTIGAAVPGNGQASIAFTPPASNGGASITSYRATCNPGGIFATRSVSPILVVGLANGTSYSCSVTATNVAGTSPASGTVSVTPRTVPGAPTIGAAVPGNGQASIAFTPPASNGGASITSYRATCSPGGAVASGVASPIVVSGLANGTSYSCSVTASNAAGTGPASGTTSVTPRTVPGAPTIGTSVPGNGQATVSFAPPASNGGSPITSYRATCNPGGIAVSEAASPIIVAGLANGTAYACSVTATNAAGTGPASGTASVTPRTVPGAPAIGVAIPGNGQASISFSPPASNGGSPITAYQVTCNPGGIAVSGTASPITVAGLANGTSYSCFVTATNAAGMSFPSGTVRVSPGEAPSAVFPMTVTSAINATTATVSVHIWFRPEDIGTTGSVYVFAIAPSNLVLPASSGAAFTLGKANAMPGEKDASLACVLAQLNATDQLRAASIPGLQAYITGVLTAQGQAVTILNNVPVANIAGTTFYVGYGPTPTQMIVNGTNRSVVTIVGSHVCKPQAPQTGWWWNPGEGGRGYSIETQGNNLFMAAYLYDVSGRATWHVAAGPTSLDGSVFSGALMSFGNGVTLNGPYRANARLPDAGPITLAFDDATRGTLVWPGGTVSIQRYAFGAGGVDTPALSGQPEGGWWWGGGRDDGRGFFIEWQGGRAYLAGYMYDAAGNAVWYAADNAVTNARFFDGTWMQFANGQTLTGAYRVPSQANGNVAPVTIQFQGADTALLTLPSGTLPITRFRF